MASTVLELRSAIFIACYQAIDKNGFSLPNKVVDVKIVENTEDSKLRKQTPKDENNEAEQEKE
jgi:hypothetical protein